MSYCKAKVFPAILNRNRRETEFSFQNSMIFSASILGKRRGPWALTWTLAPVQFINFYHTSRIEMSSLAWITLDDSSSPSFVTRPRPLYTPYVLFPITFSALSLACVVGVKRGGGGKEKRER